MHAFAFLSGNSPRFDRLGGIALIGADGLQHRPENL